MNLVSNWDRQFTREAIGPRVFAKERHDLEQALNLGASVD